MDIDDFENQAKLGAFSVVSDLESNALFLKTGRAKCLSRHDRVTINMGDRTVICRDCGAPVDPIRFMAHAADEWKACVMKLKRMRSEWEELAVQIQGRKRELKSLDFKIARRNKKLEG